jgi:hypothetical protein
MINKEKAKSSRLAALQVLVFEMNWPSFRWIEQIFHREEDSIVLLLVVYNESVKLNELEECTAMFRELFKAAYTDVENKLSVSYHSKMVVNSEWVELMSNQIFKQIAGNIAPWRLDAGR